MKNIREGIIFSSGKYKVFSLWTEKCSKIGVFDAFMENYFFSPGKYKYIFSWEEKYLKTMVF
jgi:hypothetical protein